MKFLIIVSIFLYLSCSDETLLPDDELKNLPIAITEIMYSFNGSDSLQFIELKNTTSKSIDLSGYTIIGGITYLFKDGVKILNPNEFIVLTNNAKIFKTYYPNYSPFDEFSGKLSLKSDEIFLYSSSGIEITSIEYQNQYPWPYFNNKSYSSLVPIDKTPITNQNSYSQWTISSIVGGSPGANDGENKINKVIINEFYAGDSATNAFIELYNTTDRAINLQGWYLSDEKDSIEKFKIASLTYIEPHGFVVIEENGGDISLNSRFNLSNSEHNFIISEYKNNIATGYSSLLETYYTENNHSFGYQTLTNEQSDNFTLETPTPKNSNSQFTLGEIIITQIMYHPKDGQYEYIVLKNISNNDFNLLENNGTIKAFDVKGVDVIFRENAVLKAGKKMVLFNGESDEIDLFREFYSIDSNTLIFSYNGKLSNSNEELKLLKPSKLIINKNGDETYLYSICDKVEYFDYGNWSEYADGLGYSLVRIDENRYGNDYTNWKKSESDNGKPLL